MIKYKITHDDTGEWFVVEAHTPYMARKTADRECAKRGWPVETVRSEKVWPIEGRG